MELCGPYLIIVAGFNLKMCSCCFNSCEPKKKSPEIGMRCGAWSNVDTISFAPFNMFKHFQFGWFIRPTLFCSMLLCTYDFSLLHIYIPHGIITNV